MLDFALTPTKTFALAGLPILQPPRTQRGGGKEANPASVGGRAAGWGPVTGKIQVPSLPFLSLAEPGGHREEEGGSRAASKARACLAARNRSSGLHTAVRAQWSPHSLWQKHFPQAPSLSSSDFSTQLFLQHRGRSKIHFGEDVYNLIWRPLEFFYWVR